MNVETLPQADGKVTAIVLKPKKAKKIVAANSEDIILATAHQVENMTEDQVIEYLTEVANDRGFNGFKLGAGFLKMRTESWKGQYESFKQYVEVALGMKLRKVQYMVTLYEGLVNANATWDQVKHLGWTKLGIIAPVLSAENLGEWVIKADVLTAKLLQEMVSAYKKAGAVDEGSDDKPKNDVVSFTLKFHPDQKEQFRAALDKAKAEINTEYDNVAAEAMATGYLCGTFGAPVTSSSPKTLKQMMEEIADPKAILLTFEQVYPDLDIEVTELGDEPSDADEIDEVV